MENAWPLIIFFVSAAILIRSSTVVVNRLSKIAKFFQISEFVAAFILIATATSLPDILVGVSAAVHGKPELSFANIIGANITTLTLAAGLAVIFAKGLAIRREIVRRNVVVATVAAILPVLLILDGAISRVDAVILLSLAGWYLGRLVFQRERFVKLFNNSSNGLLDLRQFFRDITVLVIAVAVLIISAEVLTRSALSLASVFDISLHYIGILLVAASITLPEVVFGVRAIIMGHKEMVVGNLIGSIVVNSGVAIGLTALIKPVVTSDFTPFLIGIIFTVVVALGFLIFSRTGKKLSLREGVVLVALYVVFVSVLILQGRGDILG